MVLASSGQGAARFSDPSPEASAEVVWHQLECGGYRADLALWRALALAAGGPVLDVGAGSGRVALELGAAGHAVTALDLNDVLLAELDRRAEGMAVQTVCADARSFELDERDFALCLVAMQTIQLLGAAGGRLEFLRRARAHLRAGGVLACAIVGELEPFDCAQGDRGPSAESVLLGDRLFVSRAMRVSRGHDSFVIERHRRIFAAHGHPRGERVRADERAPETERDLIELDLLDAAQLQDEMRQAGFQLDPVREIAATDEHVGSVVVMAHV